MKKLRNKKTGEIAKNVSSFDTRDFKIGIEYEDSKGYSSRVAYDSLAELNEEWEDYDPDEPLIEHEIVRKALKWWAVSNGIGNDASLLYERFTNSFMYDNKIVISFDSAVYDMSEKLISGNTYELVELCGEGEE